MEIYDKINDFKNSLDEEISIKEIRNIQREILLDSKLVDDIKNNNYDNDNLLIKQYRHLENEVNYIILEINMNLKQILKGEKKGRQYKVNTMVLF